MTEFEKQVESDIAKACVPITLLALTLFPAFALLDYFVHHDAYPRLWAIRFSTTAVYAALYAMIRRGSFPFPRRPFLSALLIVAIASFSITGMCLVLDGYRSPYYAGINLVTLACGLIFPLEGRRMAVAVATILGIYVAAVLLQAGFRVDRPDLLVNNLYFLFSTGIISVAGAHFATRMRRESHERYLAIDRREEMISVASHELRNPLTALNLHAQVVRSKLENGQAGLDRESARKFLDATELQVRRLDHLVGDMLDFARVHSGRLELSRDLVDLSALAGEIVATYGEEARRQGVELRLEAGAPVRGEWDRLRLEQVVLNLVTNAVKYGNRRPVDLLVRDDGDHARIEVRDRGIGIPPELRERIFERFERADAARPQASGLGLGLYIAKGIVSAHGGEIRVDSAPDEGTRFTVLLPKAG